MIIVDDSTLFPCIKVFRADVRLSLHVNMNAFPKGSTEGFSCSHVRFLFQFLVSALPGKMLKFSPKIDLFLQLPVIPDQEKQNLKLMHLRFAWFN